MRSGPLRYCAVIIIKPGARSEIPLPRASRLFSCLHLLDAHRRPDGSKWTGQQLDEATGGVVTRSYFTNLRKGRIENPGYEKMNAIAKALVGR